MEKPKTQFRYISATDSAATEILFSQSEGDNLKHKDVAENTSTYDENDISDYDNDMVDLKQKQTSFEASGAYEHTEGPGLCNSDEKQKNVHAVGCDRNNNNPEWQRGDSLEHNRFVVNKRHYSEGDANSTLSLDAISLKENMDTNIHNPPTTITQYNEGAAEQVGDCIPVRHAGPGVITPGPMSGNRSTPIFYDAVVVYAESDMSEVVAFVQFLKALLYHTSMYEPIIEYYDQGKFSSSRVSIAAELLNRASVIFIYLTKNINTREFDMFTDEAVSLTRLGMNQGHVMAGRWPSDRMWALKPVHTRPVQFRDYRTPAGLVSVRGIDWFNKDSLHTKETIISILKEARRIRQEKEALEFKVSFQPQTPASFHPQTPANWLHFPHSRFSISKKETNMTVKFRPSANQQRLTNMDHSPGPPFLQSPAYHSSQHENIIGSGIQEPRHISAINKTHYLKSSAYTPENAERKTDHSYQGFPRVLQQNKYLARGNNNTGRESELHRRSTASLRPRGPKSNQIDQRYRNLSDSNESDSTSSDDSAEIEDNLPSRLKSKKNINIIGCKYVQLGKNNRVLDEPAFLKKRKSSKMAKKRGDVEDEAMLSSECKGTQNVSSNEQESGLNPPFSLRPQRQQLLSVPRTSQGFHSSLTQDNLDMTVSRQLSDVNTNVPLSGSKNSIELKKLNLPEFSQFGVNKTNSEPALYKTSSKEFDFAGGPKVKMKREEELREYQLTLKGKKKKVFLNDLDHPESDNDESVADSVTEPNIRFCSSEEDNNALSEDPDISETETQSTVKHHHISKQNEFSTSKDPVIPENKTPSTLLEEHQEIAKRKKIMLDKQTIHRLSSPAAGIDEKQKDKTLPTILPFGQNSLNFTEIMKSLRVIHPIQSMESFGENARHEKQKDEDDVD